jgi:thioredoxin reductase
MSQLTQFPVVVLGAGPVGLAAAAHLVKLDIPVLVLEAESRIAANLETYRHVRLFSPWQYNTDRAARRLLAATGWHEPAPEGLPTAGELIDHYLAPLAQVPAIAKALHLSHRVTHLSRQTNDKVKTAGRDEAAFVIRVETPEGEREFLARAVIDASGTWSQPNPLGANGLPALGESAARGQIAYGMPDILGSERERYAGKRVLVVGTGHSAAGNLIALTSLAEHEPGTRVTWAVRGTNLGKVYGGGEADQLAARGTLGTRVRALQESGQLDVQTSFHIRSIEQLDGQLRVHAEPIDGQAIAIDGIDEIVAATGARPDLQLTRELRLRLDPWLESTDALAPLIDPNVHSCGTVRPHGHRELSHPERGYYAVGAKSYGRAPNFLLATGYEQVRSIAAALAGDLVAADDVQLALPETGVCSTRPTGDQLARTVRGACCGPAPASAAEASGCCGGPAPAGTNACCVLDAQVKADGGDGCGCGPATTAAAAGKSCGR